jgi:hypothetical protein
MTYSNVSYTTKKPLKFIERVPEIEEPATNRPILSMSLLLSSLLLVFIAMFTQYCHSSSVYVGRHASGMRVEPQQTLKGKSIITNIKYMF